VDYAQCLSKLTNELAPLERGLRIATANEQCSLCAATHNEHLHSGIGFVTPADRHEGRDIAILEQRRALYDIAQSARPERWTRAHRAWKRPSEVLLLPNTRALKLDPMTARVA
jgi:hypothetical protein